MHRLYIRTSGLRFFVRFFKLRTLENWKVSKSKCLYFRYFFTYLYKFCASETANFHRFLKGCITLLYLYFFISGLANECPPWKRKMKNEQRGTWTKPAMVLLIAVTRLSVGSIYWPEKVVRIVLMLWIDIVTPMADHRRCQAIITIIIEDLLHFIQCWTGIWPSIRGLKPILRLWNGP